MYSGTTKQCGNKGSINGATEVGRIVGMIVNTDMELCYNEGNVIAQDEDAGGLIAKINAGTAAAFLMKSIEEGEGVSAKVTFNSFPANEREHEYFEKALALTCENRHLKSENTYLKAENRTLREKLNQAYEFMKQFTIGGVNMLEKFLRSVGECVQQKVAGLIRSV